MLDLSDNQMKPRCTLEGLISLLLTILTASAMSAKPRPNPEMLVRSGHAGLIQAIGFSSSGKLLATWSFDATLVVWNTDTLQEYTRFRVETGGVPYFKLLDHKVLIGGHSGIFEYSLTRHPNKRLLVGGWINGFVVSPNGQWLAHYDIDRSVHLLNLLSLQDSILQPTRENEDFAVGLAFDLTSSHLAVSRPDGLVSFYSVGTSPEFISSTAVGSQVGLLGFDGSGNLLLLDSKSDDREVKPMGFRYAMIRFDQKTPGKPEFKDLVTDFYVSGIQTDAALKTLVLMGREPSPASWDVDSSLPGGVRIVAPPTPFSSPGFFGTPAPFAVSGDGGKIATADYLGKIVIWNIATRTGSTIPSAAVDPVRRVDLSRNQSVMVVTHQNGAADIWDMAAGGKVSEVEFGGAGQFAFATSHNWLAFFSRKRQLTLLDPLSGETVLPGLTVDKSPGNLRIVDHDKKVIWVDDISIGGHPTLKMWDMDAKTDPRTLCHMQDSRAPLESSPSAQRFATVCSSGEYPPPREIVRRGVYVWTLPSLTPRLIDRQVGVMAFSPDGDELVLSGSESVNLGSGAISEWNTPVEWTGIPSRSVSSIAFSDDGQFAYVGNNFGVDRLEVWANWKSDRRSVKVISGISEPITSVVSTKTGGVWVGSENGTVALVRGNDIAITLVSVVGAGWVDATPTGLFDGNADAISWIGWRRTKEEKLKTADTFFNSFYYPGLLAEVADGRSPVLGQTIGDLLDLPGLDYLISLHLASIENQNGKFGLCLPGVPTSSLLDGVDFRYKGRVSNVNMNNVRETKLSECRYFVPLPGDLKDYELNSRVKSTQFDSKPQNPHDLSDRPASGITVHVQTVTFNNYTAFDVLKFPEADGKAFRDFFATEAFVSEENGGPHVEVWSPLEDGTSLRDVRDRLAEIGRRSKPEDMVLLFFSGHGTVLPGQQMFFFLLDSINKRDEDNIRSGALNSAMLADAIRNMNAGRILLVIDACQSGGVLDSLKKVADVKAELRKRQRTAGPKETPEIGVAVIAAATPFELAAEQDKLGSGFLLKALLEALRTDSRDVQDLMSHLKQHMDILIGPIHKQQSPEILLSGDDFVLRTTGN